MIDGLPPSPVCALVTPPSQVRGARRLTTSIPKLAAKYQFVPLLCKVDTHIAFPVYHILPGKERPGSPHLVIRAEGVLFPLQENSHEALYRQVQSQGAEDGGGLGLVSGGDSAYHGGVQPGDRGADDGADQRQLPPASRPEAGSQGQQAEGRGGQEENHGIAPLCAWGKVEFHHQGDQAQPGHSRNIQHGQHGPGQEGTDQNANEQRQTKNTGKQGVQKIGIVFHGISLPMRWRRRKCPRR